MDNIFTIENIPEFLKKSKELLINLNLPLDRHEISNSLTNSLNRSLLGNIVNLNEVYNFMINNFKDVEKNVKIISEKVKEFNKTENNNYFVDLEDILYIVFYNQIVYIKKLLDNLINYINMNVNLVFIYAYIISMLYNEPTKVSSNYIFILEKIIESDEKSNEKLNNKLKIIIEKNKIDKIYFMIKLIYNADITFIKLLTENYNNKINKLKKENETDVSETFIEISKELKKHSILTGSGLNVEDLEKDFKVNIEYLLLQKREIKIDDIINLENIKIILQEPITLELWYGYNLFLYKRFNFDFKNYQNKINEIIETLHLTHLYKISLDNFGDLKAPDVGLINNNQIGGLNLDFFYKQKYLKYKQKYFQLKKY